MRCIGICGRDDETFSGECDDCAQLILRARCETEQIVELLEQDYDRDQPRYYAGQGYRSARSKVRFIRWTLLGTPREQLDASDTNLEFILEELKASYTKLEAVLDRYEQIKDHQRLM